MADYLGCALSYPPFTWHNREQVYVYRPLVERADSIDRRRTEAEEGLRAAEVELQREKASSETVRRNAADLQAELDRHRERLSKAESEVKTKGLLLKSGLTIEAGMALSVGAFECAIVFCHRLTRDFSKNSLRERAIIFPLLREDGCINGIDGIDGHVHH